MDWGLLRAPNGLRPKLYYFDYIWFYYVAIVANLGLRFLWVISLVHNAGTISKAIDRLRYFLPGR